MCQCKKGNKPAVCIEHEVRDRHLPPGKVDRTILQKMLNLLIQRTRKTGENVLRGILSDYFHQIQNLNDFILH